MHPHSGSGSVLFLPPLGHAFALVLGTLLTLLTPRHATAAAAPAPVWTFATRGPVFSSAVHADGVVFMGSDDQHVYALDARSGALRWSRALSAPVRSRAWIQDESVVVVAGNDAVALARDTGAPLWTFTPGDSRGAAPADRWDYHASSVIGHGDRLYYGSGSGMLYALDRRSGAVVFTFATEEQAAIRSTPVIADGLVCFGDWNGVIYALDADSGALRWRHATLSGPKPYPQFGGVVSAIVAHEGRLYFGLRNPDVICLDLATGRRVWTFTAENGSWVPGTPVIQDGCVTITGSDDHRIHALDARTGAVRWSCDVGANMFVAPLLVEDRVIVTDSNSYAEDSGRGHLHVIDRRNGQLLRSIEVGANAGASSPLRVEDLVVIASEDGRVLAYALADLLP